MKNETDRWPFLGEFSIHSPQNDPLGGILLKRGSCGGPSLILIFFHLTSDSMIEKNVRIDSCFTFVHERSPGLRGVQGPLRFTLPWLQVRGVDYSFHLLMKSIDSLMRTILMWLFLFHKNKCLFACRNERRDSSYCYPLCKRSFSLMQSISRVAFLVPIPCSNKLSADASGTGM